MLVLGFRCANRVFNHCKKSAFSKVNLIGLYNPVGMIKNRLFYFKKTTTVVDNLLMGIMRFSLLMSEDYT